MSTKYKKFEDVPTSVIAKRLNELSKACVARLNRDNNTFEREFTSRIPAELDRDADLVLSIAAKRIKELEWRLEEVTAALKPFAIYACEGDRCECNNCTAKLLTWDK